MRKFIKFCLITAVILILAGLILGVASIAGGGGKDVAQMVQNGELTYDFFRFSLFDSEWDFEDILSMEFADADPIYDLDDVEVFDGGKEVLSGNISRMELNIGEIDDFELSLGGGEFYVKSSGDDKFYLEAENAEKLQVYAEDETLYLKALRTKTGGNEMNMTLSIPEGRLFDEMKLELGAGSVKVENGLMLEHFQGEVGAGQMIIEGLTCVGFDVNVGAGEFLGKELTVNGEAELKVGAGHISFNGEVQDDLDVECSLGGAELTLDGVEADYNYEIDCSAGSIHVGSAEYAGLASDRTINNGASKEMNLECAMGAIEVKFKE